jgi:DNA-binding beta-propeller fold protein YncE
MSPTMSTTALDQESSETMSTRKLTSRPRRPRKTLGLGLAAVSAGTAALLGLTATSASAAPLPHRLAGLCDKTLASVVAPNGDRIPFGIAVVPLTAGDLTAGNLLVAEFDDQAGTAGAGSTILEVNPTTGTSSVFYQGGPVAGPVGIAINPANDGVWIGDYGSAADGTAANDLLISPTGQLKATFTETTTAGAASFIGVWGQGVSSSAGTISFYYGNAGNATTGTGGGDVWRLTPHPAGPVNGQPLNSTYAQIATGQGETPAGGNAATAAGPQGFAFDASTGTLYETNDADNTLYAIPDAAAATAPVTARIVYRGPQLSSPENLALDPLNGNLLVVNANDNRLVEITPAGHVVASRDLAKHQPAGALFGLATGTDAAGQAVLYYGNSDTNTLHELVLDTHQGQ